MEIARIIIRDLLKSIDFTERDGISSSQNETKSIKIPDYYRYIKLIKSDDLKDLETLPDWKANCGISLYDYKSSNEYYNELVKKIESIVHLKQDINNLDNDSLIQYNEENITIKGRGILSLFSKEYEILRFSRVYSTTVIKINNIVIKEDSLSVIRRWKSQEIKISYYCYSSQYHSEKILDNKKSIKSEVEKNIDILYELKHLVEADFDLPVLFISHRWSGKLYPDESNSTLNRLKALENCYIIYDYSSFPQNPRNVKLKSALKKILKNMSDLVRKIVIIESKDYLTRGWCLYEYIVASIHKSIICDTIREKEFEDLRNWRLTVPMVDDFKHLEAFGFKNTKADTSLRQNYINEMVLKSINNIIPRFKNAKFSLESDRELVLDNLFKELLNILPKKKEYIPYMSEWTYSDWTEEELRGAFDEPLKTHLGEPTISIDPNNVVVASSIEEAKKEYFLLRKGNQEHTFIS